MARTWVYAVTVAACALALAACKRPEPKTRGPGDSLKSFIIANTETGKQYCQVCVFSGKPVIMAIGAPDDETFAKGLEHIQTLVETHADKGLRAFALAGVPKGTAVEPFPDEARAAAELKALRARLGLAYPMTMLPAKVASEDLRNFAKFAELYELAGVPTVLVATAENEIVYAGVLAKSGLEAQLGALDAAVSKAL